MISETALKLMKCFPRSLIICSGEFIAHKEANEYFNLSKCADELEVKCKVLEWLSRAAYKGQPFRSAKKNNELNKFMLKGINEFLDTNFGETEIGTIYRELGNQVNRELTIKFIESNYDMEVLKSEITNEKL